MTLYRETSVRAAITKKAQLNALYENWLKEFEINILEKERDLYDKINDEEDNFMNYILEEEETFLKPLVETKLKFIVQKEQSIESFEDIKSKLLQRMYLN